MSTRIITDSNGRKHITNEPLLHQPASVPTSWMEMVTVNLLREGVNKHKARELAEHFYSFAPAAQPAPVQEPCGRLESDPDEGHIFVPRIEGDWSMLGEDLYTIPPAAQRQWVGLTDEAIWSEYQTLWSFHPAEEPRMAKDIAKFARAIEAKLKEKNT